MHGECIFKFGKNNVGVKSLYIFGLIEGCHAYLMFCCNKQRYNIY